MGKQFHAEGFRGQQAKEMAERLAETLPLHDTLTPLGQFRAYLRHFLHPQATMADAARMLLLHLLQGTHINNAHFPSELWQPAVAWIKAQLKEPLPQFPDQAFPPAAAGIHLLPILPHKKTGISSIHLPFIQEYWLFEAISQHFPKAKIHAFSPTLEGIRAVPQAFWLQPILLGNGASPSQGQSAFFEGKQAWEQGWDMLDKGADLTVASLLDLPTERFERGKSRLIEAIDEQVATNVLPLSAWEAPNYRRHTVRMLYWIMSRQTEGHLLLLLPQWLMKEADFDGVRAFMDRNSLSMNMVEIGVLHKEPAFACWITLGSNALPPKRQLLAEPPRTLLLDWQGWCNLPNESIALGETLPRKTEKDAPLRFFHRAFEIKPWPTEDCTLLRQAQWQLSPLGIEAHEWMIPSGQAWLDIFFGEKLDQPNWVLLVSQEPFAVWAFDKPFVPDALEGEKLLAFPLYTYKNGKRKENMPAATLRALKKWIEGLYPIPAGADSAPLLALLEEAAKLSRLMPVLQKYVQQLQQFVSASSSLQNENFDDFLKEIAKFRSKIQHLMPGAYERKATFDRLLLCLSSLEETLSQSQAHRAAASAKQQMNTAEGLFCYLYACLQNADYQEKNREWLKWRLPFITYSPTAWEMHHAGHSLLDAVKLEGKDEPIFSFSWEELAKTPFAKWQEGAPPLPPYLAGKPLRRLAWEALRKMGKLGIQGASPDRQWAAILAREEKWLEAVAQII